nr:hypothetical protein [Tanacetum cinerariifolium]
MADVNAPSSQAPAMAPPVRTDEEIMPCNRALTASSTILSIYIQLQTANIREASYYQEYQANVAKHRRFQAGETGSAQDSPAPNPAKPARKPKPKAKKARINILQNPNAGSATSFGTVISFTYAFSASSSDKTWNLILRLKIRRIFRNLESFWVFNSLVHSFRAMSALRRSSLRTASTAAKPCQGDSSEFYLITGRILTVAAANQKDVNSQLDAHTSNSLSMTAKRPTTQLPQL